ncbi:MAG: DUF134 domain-containing protein [Bacteroidota bacterium]
MPRPQFNRIVSEPPLYSQFKPMGVRGQDVKQIVLTLDEFEAFRLADQLGYSHARAADDMEISRSTFSRLIEKARKKIADFIILGGVLTIGGGSVHFRVNILQCRDCGHMFKVQFDDQISECPECHSGKILNLAGSFGHGKCCIQ